MQLLKYASLLISVAATTSQYCNGMSGICLAINRLGDAPDRVNVQMSAPSNIGWAAIGFGDGMVDVLMFLMYKSTEGNITLSTRYSQAYRQPSVYKNSDTKLMEGSGQSVDGRLVANFQCMNCSKWVDFGSDQQKFVWAMSPVSPANAGSADADISRHAIVGKFKLDLSIAGNETELPKIVSPISGQWSRIVVAHGLFMAISWAILFPGGVIILRLLNDKLSDAFALHWRIQIASSTIVLVAIILGAIASVGQQFAYFHQWLGIILFLALPAQIVLGYVHHRLYINTRPIHTKWWTRLHIWFGRLAITIGALLNIGLGLQMAGVGVAGQATWYVIAILLLMIYGFLFRKRQNRLNSEILDSVRHPGDPAILQDTSWTLQQHDSDSELGYYGQPNQNRSSYQVERACDSVSHSKPSITS